MMEKFKADLIKDLKRKESGTHPSTFLQKFLARNGAALQPYQNDMGETEY
jgi:hypothetical protein